MANTWISRVLERSNSLLTLDLRAVGGPTAPTVHLCLWARARARRRRPAACPLRCACVGRRAWHLAAFVCGLWLLPRNKHIHVRSCVRSGQHAHPSSSHPAGHDKQQGAQSKPDSQTATNTCTCSPAPAAQTCALLKITNSIASKIGGQRASNSSVLARHWANTPLSHFARLGQQPPCHGV